MVARPRTLADTARADVEALRNLVTPATLARGLNYAHTGAVVEVEWHDRATRATAKVQGNDPQPYNVTVTVSRDSRNQLTSMTSACSCPVGFSCKHAVAVVLANPTPPRAHLSVVAPLPRADDWATVLAGLATRPLDDAEARPAAVALLFELGQRRVPTRSGAMATRPSIGVVPVVRSPAGNWVRSGITWTTMPSRVTGARARAQATLLEEFRALSTLGARHWQFNGGGPVWLESIPSRRVYDVLGELADAGVPLVGPGRSAPPVQLAPPIDVVLDVRRDDAGLTLGFELRANGQRVSLDRAVLLGDPAHGVAWQMAGSGPSKVVTLTLAPLVRPIDDALGRLLERRTLHVPAADAERFVDMAATLRSRVTVSSSDGSVQLPEGGDTVVVTLTHLPGPALSVAWYLVGADGARRPTTTSPDAEAAATLRAAAAVVPTTSTTLEGIDAARFMTDVAGRLEAVDGLVVEHEGDAPRYQEAAPVVRIGGSSAPGSDWFDLDVEVTVGGETVPFGLLFAALASGQSHLVLPSGTYFPFDGNDLGRLAELIAEARSLSDDPKRPRVSRYQASLFEDLAELGVLDEQAAGWGASLQAMVDTLDTEVPPPAGLLATLRPYQLEGFRWLAARHACRLGGILADDMGLGKTLQALALVCHCVENDPEEVTVAPFVVVAPTSVVPGWVDEARRFAPHLRVVAVTETERRRGTTLADHVAGAHLVITSFALARIERDSYEALRWSGLFLDEAQFAKNPASANHSFARRLPAPWKVALTGTPFENNLGELWALTNITAPGLWPRHDRFKEAYRTPIERHGDSEKLDQLRRRMKPVMLRRTKAQVAAELPDKQEQVLELQLGPAHRKLYETYLARERQKVLGLLDDLDGNRFEIFRSLTLLRQAALDISLVDSARTAPSAKLDALTEMVEEAAADGHRMLVFSQFTRFLTRARERVEAAGIESCYLDGTTTRRGDVIARFRAGDAPVFFISLKAGGFGLNLTEADHCVLLDPWWNPATEAQAVDRIHRIGQARKVMVYRMVSAGTIEEKVMALKARKAALFASVVEGGGFESAALSAADIRELLG